MAMLLTPGSTRDWEPTPAARTPTRHVLGQLVPLRRLGRTRGPQRRAADSRRDRRGRLGRAALRGRATRGDPRHRSGGRAAPRHRRCTARRLGAHDRRGCIGSHREAAASSQRPGRRHPLAYRGTGAACALRGARARCHHHRLRLLVDRERVHAIHRRQPRRCAGTITCRPAATEVPVTGRQPASIADAARAVTPPAPATTGAGAPLDASAPPAVDATDSAATGTVAPANTPPAPETEPGAAPETAPEPAAEAQAASPAFRAPAPGVYSYAT